MRPPMARSRRKKKRPVEPSAFSGKRGLAGQIRLSRLIPAFGGFRSADDKLPAEEFFVMQFPHGAQCFVDRLHLDERKALRTLRVAMTHHLRRHDLAHTVEKLREIALRGVKREIAH